MCHIALKIPLGLLTQVGGRQGRNAAHTWVQALGDALDGAPFAGSIAPFKTNHNFLAGFDHPILQFDQFTLQSEQFAKIQAPTLSVGDRFGIDSAFSHVVQIAVFKVQLKFFVIAVRQITAYALNQFVIGGNHVGLLLPGLCRSI
jgi:hypothetical protein